MRSRYILMACAVVAAVVTAFALFDDGDKRDRQQGDIVALKADVARLESENARLEESARRLREGERDSAVYLEKAAREELGLVKPDEHVLLLNEPRDGRGETP